MRTFSKMIRRSIEASDMPLREVIQRCKRDYGVSIDISYLSKLQNDSCPPPSDPVVRALAQALGLDPLKLALQAHIDRAPEDLRSYLSAV